MHSAPNIKGIEIYYVTYISITQNFKGELYWQNRRRKLRAREY
jgi:hypothetical protein